MTNGPDRDRVLIVDDDPMSIMLLGRLLKDAGHDVLTAHTGEVALTLAADADLVVLDISLPGMNGYDVARRLKDDVRFGSLPIVFISSEARVIDKARAFEVGGSDYITKPFDFEETRLRIENQLRMARLRGEVLRQNAELLEKNRELERFVAAIRERESPLFDTGGHRRITTEHPAESYRRLDRIFTALSEVLPGTVLDGRYRLDALIGTGGFGAVYRGTHLVLDRPVAVKVLQPPRGPEAERHLERFRTEAMSAYRFNHPNAVSVLDASVSSSGLPYIVMDLLEGWSLRDEIQKSGGVSLRRCAEIMVPVCDAISRAHNAGITHRDIKPDNIFIDVRGGTESVKVLDFGLARFIEQDDPSMNTSESVIGTPPYMAPECFARSETDPEKVDMYAIAVVTFEALTGRLPFPFGPGGFGEMVTKHLLEAPPRLRDLLPEIPQLVDDLVSAGMEKKPGARPTVRAFGEQLVIATVSDGELLSEEDVRTLRLHPLDDE